MRAQEREARSPMRYTLLTFVLGFLVSGGSAHSQTGSDPVKNVPEDTAVQYFPLGVFGQNTNKEPRYASFLAAMQEPSLFETARKSEITEYRLLLVLSDRALSFRLELLVDGTGELAVARAICQSGKPNSVVVKDRIPASAEHVREFLTLLQKADFWKSETEEARDKVHDGKDGIHWVLEGVRNREYHVVDRVSTEENDFARVCIFLMTLTPTNLDEHAEKQTN
jgi:hypothetical protein